MWERANDGPWDAAVEGSSALRAALTFMFGNEVAYYRGEATLSTLYDMEKFYDIISIPNTHNRGHKIGIPTTGTQVRASDAYGM
eukprot:9800624-Karenia_brevis.AAC.1